MREVEGWRLQQWVRWVIAFRYGRMDEDNSFLVIQLFPDGLEGRVAQVLSAIRCEEAGTIGM